jgi:hypothetical protein
LLGQARHLALLDPTRPQQVNLRRAISSAYYALFHFLIEEANRFLIGTTTERTGLRNVLTRAFAHTEMATTARSFATGPLPPGILQRMGTTPIPASLRQSAQTFLVAQELRHLGDYDLARTFLRSEVLALINRVEQVFAAWPALRDNRATELFLLGLLVWNRIRDR